MDKQFIIPDGLISEVRETNGVASDFQAMLLISPVVGWIANNPPTPSDIQMQELLKEAGFGFVEGPARSAVRFLVRKWVSRMFDDPSGEE